MSALTSFSAHNGATKSIAVDTAQATAVFPNLQNKELVLTNVGDEVTFVRISRTTDATAVTAATDMPLLPNSQILVRHPAAGESLTVRAIAAASGNTLYITPGAGSA